MNDFNQVFREHFCSIYKFSYGIIGCEEESGDIAQETFLRLFRQLKSGQELYNPRAWLFRVAANICYNFLKRKKTQQRFMEKSHLLKNEVMNSNGLNLPEKACIKSEERDMIRNEISSLPDKHRILLMLYLEGFSYKEMAKMTRIKKSSVGVVISRAIDILEKRMN